MKCTNIRVITTPVEIEWHCPFCNKKNETTYKEFCDQYGEMRDWEYKTMTCPYCGETYSFARGYLD